MRATAATPKLAQKIQPKVLRIGVVRDGKIVQERLIRHGESVSVGESPRNTVVVAGRVGARHELLRFSGGSYVLNVPDWVEGSIQSGEGVRGLGDLRARAEMTRQGEGWQLQLGEHVRGKISLGTTTLLFQFVPAPPEPIRPVTPADFRSHLLDEEDPLFLGLLGVFTVVAAAFMLYVYVTPLVEHVEVGEIEAAANLVVTARLELPVLPDPSDTVATPVVKPTPKPAPAAKAPVVKVTPPAATVESVRQRSLFLQMIGTDGEGDGDEIDVLGDDAAAMAGINEALDSVTGVQVATADNVQLAGGSAEGRVDASITIDGADAGGISGTSTTGPVQVRAPRVEDGAGVVDGGDGDTSGVEVVVKKSRGLIESCLAQSLKLDPEVSGRVSVGWTIQGGRVSESHLLTNTTRDAALGQCIEKKVRSFRFSPDVSTTVDSYAWALSGQ